MDWARVLAYVTGTVDQELLARNEYLAAENRILKAQLKGPLKLSDAERFTSDLVGKIAGDRIARALGRLQIVRRYDDEQVHVPRSSKIDHRHRRLLRPRQATTSPLQSAGRVLCRRLVVPDVAL